MSREFIFRLVGMLVFAILGGYWGFGFATANHQEIFGYTGGIALVGALFGLIATPYFTTRPVRGLRTLLVRVPAEGLLTGLTGLIIGLLVAALLTFPLSLLPQPLGSVLPFVGVLLFGYFGVALFSMRQTDMLNAIASLTNRNGETEGGGSSTWGQSSRTILLDTSVIIDGRV